MSILHLADPSSPGGGPCTLRLLADHIRAQPEPQRVLVFGGRRDVDLARACGLSPFGSLSAPMKLAPLARNGLRRIVSQMERIAGRVETICAWSAETAVLAAIACPDRPRQAMLTRGPETATARMLPRMLKRRPIALAAVSQSVADEYAAIGISASEFRIVPPRIDPGLIDPRDRAALRRRWRVDDRTLVVATLGEPVCQVDARMVLTIGSHVLASGRRLRMLVHPSAWRRVPALDWARNIRDLTGRTSNFTQTLLTEPWMEEPWRILAGADAGLFLGGDALQCPPSRRRHALPSLIPLHWALTAQLPIVAEDFPGAGELLHDAPRSSIVAPGDHLAAAHDIVQLHNAVMSASSPTAAESRVAIALSIG